MSINLVCSLYSFGLLRLVVAAVQDHHRDCVPGVVLRERLLPHRGGVGCLLGVGVFDVQRLHHRVIFGEAAREVGVNVACYGVDLVLDRSGVGVEVEVLGVVHQDGHCARPWCRWRDVCTIRVQFRVVHHAVRQRIRDLDSAAGGNVYIDVEHAARNLYGHAGFVNRHATEVGDTGRRVNSDWSVHVVVVAVERVREEARRSRVGDGVRERVSEASLRAADLVAAAVDKHLCRRDQSAIGVQVNRRHNGIAITVNANHHVAIDRESCVRE